MKDRSLRIIGGKWRGHKVSFPNGDVRPTADRVRETLFNWLMHEINATTCLDLYTGSGALGLEALSRGASHVTMIDQDKNVTRQLSHSLKSLNADAPSFSIINDRALNWLASCTEQFDIVFIDPPFATGELEQACQLVAERNIAAKFVYLESNVSADEHDLPSSWRSQRQKRAGSVHYSLFITG